MCREEDVGRLNPHRYQQQLHPPEGHGCAHTCTLKPAGMCLRVQLVSCLTSQGRKLVNNSPYLPVPAVHAYTVCIAAQVDE